MSGAVGGTGCLGLFCACVWAGARVCHQVRRQRSVDHKIRELIVALELFKCRVVLCFGFVVVSLNILMSCSSVRRVSLGVSHGLSVLSELVTQVPPVDLGRGPAGSLGARRLTRLLLLFLFLIACARWCVACFVSEFGQRAFAERLAKNFATIACFNFVCYC